MSLDYDVHRRVREYLEKFDGDHLTPRQVQTRFRLSDDDMQDIRDLMIEVAILGRKRDHDRKPKVLIPPALVLDMLVFAIASAGAEPRDLLAYCQPCRNHLLYLLDTAPYTDSPGAQIHTRLRALPEVHKAHIAGRPADLDPPRIRWISS